MSGETLQDAAWVTIPTRLPVAEVVDFCRDIERLLRINSMYEFEDWHETGPDSYAMKIHNLSNGQTLEVPFSVVRHADGVELVYGAGLKARTRFKVEPGPQGANLIVTDDYAGTPMTERESRAAEIDKSLVYWGNDLHRYLEQWRRWSAFRVWRWYMARVWQPMKPRARRVAFMVIVITALEFVAFLAVFLIFAMEWQRHLRFW